MLVSSARRLKNVVSGYEKDSDRLIDASLYYIVNITIDDESFDATQLCKKLAYLQNHEYPLVSYVYKNDVFLLFSSTDDKEHQFNGSHQMICSEYASISTLETKIKAKCTIVEMDTRTKVVIYFQTKIYENLCRYIQSLSVDISRKDLENYTLKEIENKLMETLSIDISKVESERKYGGFYKYLHDKGKFHTLSNIINLQTMETFINYFFT